MKKLNIRIDDTLNISLDPIGPLQEALYANLQYLKVDVPDNSDWDSQEKFLILLPPLLRPTLHHFILNNSSPPDDLLPSMLRLVKARTGFLETLALTMEFFYSSPEVRTAITELMEGNPNLRHVSVSQASENYQLLYKAALSLPNLSYLSFYCNSIREYDPEVQPIGRIFPSLSTFRGDLGTQSFPHVLPFLPVSTLQHLTLYSCSSPQCPSDSLGPISYFVHLKTLHIHLIARPPIWEGILRHVLPCVQLESLNVSTPTFARDLSDGMIRTMAQAWPSLQHLTLLPRRGQRPLATLQGLACFARFCPALETLKLGVDASGLPEEVQMPFVGSSLKTLDLAVWSKLNDGEEDKIADYICRMWPNHQIKPLEVIQRTARWAPVWTAVNGKLAERNSEQMDIAAFPADV